MTRIAGPAHDERTAAVQAALAFLRRRQLPHGEFVTMLGADRQMSRAAFDSSPFTTTFVLDALAQLERANVADMVGKAVAFLSAEMQFGGVWRYWSTRDHKHARLPPDLDDTACASSALELAGRRAPRNAWAFLSNRDAAGRFRTWLLPHSRNRWDVRFSVARAVGERQARGRMRAVPPPATEDPRFRVMRIDSDDVDPVVNANVLLYLGERSETRAAIDFVAQAVRDGPAAPSTFYEDPLALDFAVARAFARSTPAFAALREPILTRIERRIAQATAPTVLHAALALSALLTFDGDGNLAAELQRTILSAQRPDGGWDAFAFYNVWGSEELTTALCLGALARPATAAATRRSP